MNTNGRSQRTEVVDSWQRPGQGEKCKKATSIYQVQAYYEDPDPEWSKSVGYTLIKVRITTGLTHQIRVHMAQLLWTLQHEMDGWGDWGDYGIVSDFLYSRKTSSYDNKNVSERVFLHERLFGLWDPDKPSQTRWVVAPLPEELVACLKKLKKDTNSAEKLRAYQVEKPKEDPVEAFANGIIGRTL